MTKSPLTRLILLAALAATVTLSHSQPEPSQSRGRLLYTTHCIECHTMQMHWRNDRRAQDWESLKAQVRRWQGTAALAWSDEDIVEVARHLNETVYHYPQTADRLSLATPPRSNPGRTLDHGIATARNPA